MSIREPLSLLINGVLISSNALHLGTDHLTLFQFLTYGFLFRSEIFFRTTQELEHLIFFPELNIRLHDKNSESYYFFFPPPKSEFFFSNIGNQNIFLEKEP
jgi:hypothetical protein